MDETDLTKQSSMGRVGVANSVGKSNNSKTSLPLAMSHISSLEVGLTVQSTLHAVAHLIPTGAPGWEV